MKKLLFFIALTLFSATQVWGQQKIKDGTVAGQNLPNKDALLELESLNKGLLHVRLELKELSDPSPLSAHTAGMMVYNTAQTADVQPGIYYNDGTQWVRLGSGDSSSETVTTLINNNDGTYTYTSEDGTVTVIDVPANVIENFQTIIQDNGVRNEILNLIQEVGGNVYYDGDKFTYIDGDGEIVDISFEEIVKAYETITTIEDNGDGTFTYINEAGDTFVIDIPASVVENFENIVNKGPVTINGDTFNTIEDYITHIANSSIGLEGSDFITVTGSGTDADPYKINIKSGDANSMLITDANGDLVWATIEDVVKASETVTILVDNGDGTFTYTNENGVPVTFDANTLNLTDNGDGSYTFVDASGNTTVINSLADIVNNFEEFVTNNPVTVGGNTYNNIEEYFNTLIESHETVTTLVEENGIYTYTSEDGTITIIDIPASVVENFETIVNDGPVTVNGETYTTVEEYLTYVANESVTIGGSDFINVTGSGTTADPYVVAIEEGAANSMLITNDQGELEWATIESIVQSNETITTLVEENGIYTYTSEDGTVTVIDIPASVIENFETIVNDGPVTVNGETFNTVEEYITHIANESVTIGGSDFINVTGSGTTADPYVVAIEEGAANSMLITNDAGDLEWATIESIVQSNETLTVLTDHGDGTFTYTDENGGDVTFDATRSAIIDNGDGTYTVKDADGNDVTIDIPGDIVSNFETIINGGPVTVNNETYTTVEEYFTDLIDNNETLTELDYDAAANQLNFKDENGVTHNIQLNNTSLSYDDTSQELVYVDSEGNTSTINLNDLVNSNINTGNLTTTIDERIDIVNGADALLHDVQIDVNEGNLRLQNIGGTLQVSQIENGGPGQILVTNEGGNGVTWADPLAIAKGNLTSDDIEVTNGANSILRDVSLEIKDGAITTDKLDDKAVTSDKLDGGTGDDGRVGVADDQGNITYVTLDEVVKDNETVTTLVSLGEGKYEYTSEDNTKTIIDVPTSVVENFETIVNEGPVEINGETYTTIEEYITQLAENVSNVEGSDLIEVTGDGSDANPYKVVIKDGPSDSMLITDDQGNPVWATIDDIVKDNETVTTLVSLGEGKYEYTSEDNTKTIIDVPASVVENFETIVQEGPVTVDGDEYTTIEEYITYLANNVSNVEGSEFITVSGDGTADNPYKVEIKEGDVNSMLVTNDQGELEWATIDSLVNSNIDAKDLTAAVDESTDPENPSTNTTIEIVEGGQNAVLVETSIRVKEESITTDHIQNGTIKPEDIAQAGDNQILVTDEDGNPEWKDVDKVTPRFFYMPAVIFDTKETGNGLKRDLYQDYVNQFQGVNPYDIAHGTNGTSLPYTGGIISSDSTKPTIPVFAKGELIYYITYYDTEVFANLSINEDGELTYDIIGNATPSSYMNIVFVIK